MHFSDRKDTFVVVACSVNCKCVNVLHSKSFLLGYFLVLSLLTETVRIELDLGSFFQVLFLKEHINCS